ncbi:MAG: hypothetical protein BWK79_09115 [Beggiatoa sp. IS2]|nr:MAG: hypothetical protein BWK79_09115 [Beggiatoa sp. IS2]
MSSIFPAIAGLLFNLLIVFNSLATPLLPQEVPEPLRPWVNWVLPDPVTCPFFYNRSLDESTTKQICQWPSRLILKVNTTQAQFSQTWQVYHAGWIALPGDSKNWPQAVKTKEATVLVADHQGIPHVYLPEGITTLDGQFLWERRPENLQIPVHSGLIELTLDDKPILYPELDEKGRLWLRQRGKQAEGEAAEENRLSIRVYRHIIDEIPLQMQTRIELDIAGRPREVVLGPVLLEKQLPMALDSPLPARLESEGRLRVQVRPGTWVITLQTRQLGEVNQLTAVTPLAGESVPTWVEEEIWVFEARNELRFVEISGGMAIDPQQTTLPQEWRKFPSYQVKAGEILELVTSRRGDPVPTPDQLQLQRDFWLDFDGQGYSVQDHLEGTATQGKRLEMASPATLGRVSVNGENQLITQLPDSKEMGVEVRHGRINLVADSRLEESLSELPAVGWTHDFQQVNTTLHLPPGWRLLNVIGADNVSGVWLKQWTLLDLFIVLMIVFAIGKLWRWYWGVLALLTLILIYQEVNAPRWIWLNVLIAIALLRVLPTLNWMNRLAQAYRNVSLIALIIIVLPFMVQQVRQGLYPQLEYAWATLENNKSSAYPQDAMQTESAPMPMMKTPPAQVEEQVQQSVPMSKGDNEYKNNNDEYNFSLGRSKKAEKSRKQLAQIDPNALVQTGQGLPQWQWRNISMSWSGPVEQHQQLQLWLISPMVNSLLAYVRVVLLAFLTVFLLSNAWGFQMTSWFKSKTMLAMGLSLLVLTSFMTYPVISQAGDYPPKYLLEELKNRLLAPPDCLPYCASSPRMRLELDAHQLQLRLEVHSHEDVAIPLPGQANQWLPQQVWLNGEPASGLWRNSEGQLWLNTTKGIHQIQLVGTLPTRHTIQLSLPLKPHFIETQIQGWRIEGLHENGLADDSLQFTREQGQEMPIAELEMGNLPPFVQIERTLLLGLDWQVETKVTRLTPLGSAVVLEIPLLPGESVTSEDIRVHEGKALMNLSPDQEEITWISVFNLQETVELIAPESINSTEVWKLDASAIWHVQVEGIPVIHHQDTEGRWLPEWRPWPGEKVTLHLSRPQGVSGQVVTIDRSSLAVSPGQRTTESMLSLNLRSSRGGPHVITLPENAELLSIKINEASQPLRPEGRKITLPIVPGVQRIELSFRQPLGLSQRFTTPEVHLGIPSVNTRIEVKMPQDRWILLTDTSVVGPAVLMWGILIIVVLSAIGLGRVSLTPLKTIHWLLLGLVLSQIEVGLALWVVGWFILLGMRARLKTETVSALKFNLIQISLIFITIIALSILLAAIHQGLLGRPNMHIAGNGSNAYLLRWYEDRTEGVLPQVWVISWSIWIYRFAMLAWALWLAFALLHWLRWGWQCFNSQELWRSMKIVRNKNVT